MAGEIDLNADVGEGFGRWRAGEDAELLGFLTSANVACGFHAGDAATMRRVCALAGERGVAVGAHVGYPDLAGFGRREMRLTPAEIGDAVIYQLGALAACAASVGTRVSYVKPHGALYHRAGREADAALALVAAIRAVDPGLALLAPPGSALLAAAADQGLPAVAEGFADRAYRADGGLLERSLAGAELDPESAAAQAVLLATRGEARAIDGQPVALPVRSLCLHGDGAEAVATAAAVAASLAAARVILRSFA